jgi:hypothetical protein
MKTAVKGKSTVCTGADVDSVTGKCELEDAEEAGVEPTKPRIREFDGF